jgi:hypothetical protein
MTLWDITTGFVLVALLFLLVARQIHGKLIRPALWWVLAEALVLTLLGGLWFGSIGRGSWLLVFSLLGLLNAGSGRGLRSAFLRSADRPSWRAFVVDFARYVVAGALLAWRLG